MADLARRGARVEKASFKDPTGLKRVLQGVERLLLISTDAVGARLEHHRQAISAAARAGVWHIAYTSIAQPSADNPALIVPDHCRPSRRSAKSGLVMDVLRTNLYARGACAGRQAGAGIRVVGSQRG